MTELSIRNNEREGRRMTRVITGLVAAASVLLAAGVLAPSDVGAQVNPMMKEQLDRIPTGDEGVKQILDPMTERLGLTADQLKEVRPIVADLVSTMESSKAKLESGETTIMKFMMEMNASGESAATQIEQHLDEKQLTEYAAMREEQKQRMMDERRKAMQDMMKARQAEAAAGGTP